MQKQAWTWTTPRFPQPARLVRWGHFGVPVLIFPTAGGDFEEIERFQLVAALGSLIDNGRIKVYSVDGLDARASLIPWPPTFGKPGFDAFLYEDVLQRIRTDCQDPQIEPILAGADLGAATAVRTLCFHPDSFRGAIALSGVYNDLLFMVSDPGMRLPERLKRRWITLGTGSGDYEQPEHSRTLAGLFRAQGIDCRFEDWGPTRAHTWSTWRDQLPRLLGERL
jgi:esterase/lipase superfamily enzyme